MSDRPASFKEMQDLIRDSPEKAEVNLYFYINHLKTCSKCRTMSGEIERHVKIDIEKGKGVFKGA